MASSSKSPLFTASDTEQVRVALRDLGGSLIGDLHDDLDAALHGSDEATRRYVREYRELTDRLLAAASDGREIVIGHRGVGKTFVADVLGHASAEAPFSPWATAFDLGDAVALDLTSRLRSLVGASALPAPAGPPELELDELAAQRFLRRVRHHLNHPDDEHPLLRLMALFDLSKSELGRLFGVSRQGIDGWIAKGVPAERQEKLATLLALSDLLERKLKPGRVPGVARRPADAYGGETMLGMIGADRHRELLDSVRASFDWSHAA